MLKIEENFYPVCVRIEAGHIGMCRQAASGKDMKALLETDATFGNECLCAFLFGSEKDQTLFSLSSPGTKIANTIAFKLSGDIEDVPAIRKKIEEIGKCRRLLSAVRPLSDEYAILALFECKSKEEADAILDIAKNGIEEAEEADKETQ